MAGRQPHRNNYSQRRRTISWLIGMASTERPRDKGTRRGYPDSGEKPALSRGCVASAVGGCEVQHGFLYHGANEPQAVALPPRFGGRAGHVHARDALPVGWVARQETPKTAAPTASGSSVLPRHRGGRARADWQLNCRRGWPTADASPRLYSWVPDRACRTFYIIEHQWLYVSHRK